MMLGQNPDIRTFDPYIILYDESGQMAFFSAGSHLVSENKRRHIIKLRGILHEIRNRRTYRSIYILHRGRDVFIQGFYHPVFPEHVLIRIRSLGNSV